MLRTGGFNGHDSKYGCRRIATSDDLNSVLQKFTEKNIDSLPVVTDDDHGVLMGMLNRREVIAFYNDKIREMKQKKN
jgi:hypothetical protein